MLALKSYDFSQDFLFDRPGTGRVADARSRCNGCALLPRSIPLSLLLWPSNVARLRRSGDRIGLFGNTSPSSATTLSGPLALRPTSTTTAPWKRRSTSPTTPPLAPPCSTTAARKRSLSTKQSGSPFNPLARISNLIQTFRPSSGLQRQKETGTTEELS